MKSFLDAHLLLIKALLFIFFGVVAVLIGIEHPWKASAWAAFVILAGLLVFLEIYQHRQGMATPLQKVTKNLWDFEGWKKSGLNDYYAPNPEFVISPLDDEHSSLDYRQEWTRGEIGYHLESGNAAYHAGVYKDELLLHKIHVVLFDGGKKIMVAPDWEALGQGRFYYYLRDSIDYAYQQYLSQERGIDHSLLIKSSELGQHFDIPVLKNSEELRQFVAYCGEPGQSPTTNENEQTEIFYSLLERYDNFKQRKQS